MGSTFDLSQYGSTYDPEEYEKLYGSKLRPKYPRVNPTLEKKDSTVDSILEGITKEEYDTLIDSLTNHPEYFGPDYTGTYPKDFGEAVIKVFIQKFASDEIYSQMSPEQKLNMFHNTNKFREKKMSEIKELGIEKDLFDGGILSSKKMPPKNVFSSLSELINKPSAAPTSEGITPTSLRAPAAPKGALKKKAPFRMKGGAWPVSSIFSNTTFNEELMQETAAASSTVGSYIGLLSAWITGAVSYSTIAIGWSITGMPVGVYIVYRLSCVIANKILERNNIYFSPVVGDNETGPIEIIKKWFQNGQRIWRGLGLRRGAPMPDMPQMQEYNGSILDYIQSNVGNAADYMGNIIIRKMSQPGFALFGTICTIGDIASNLITAPFYGFAYLAKKMFSHNNAAVLPVNDVEAQLNPLAPIDLSQRDLTPIDRYTKNISLLNENIFSLNGEDADNYDPLNKKLDVKYKTCVFCTNHICNNGRYIQCITCVPGVCHYDNMIGGCKFANTVCRSDNIDIKNKCPTCRTPWRLCTGNTLSLLPEDTDDIGFTVVNGPCLTPDNIALTDDEIIADNKTLIGILDKHLTEELKTQIAREPEIDLDHIVSLRAREKKGDDELDRNVTTKITIKPIGGSKKRKNKTKRRKNKNTRRRRRRRTRR